MRRVLAPLTSVTTYLRWTCLILGGALATPYVMAGSVVDGLLRLPDPEGYPLLVRDPVVFTAMLPVIALTGLFLPVRGLELTAARGLLGVEVGPVPPGGKRTWAERRRTSAWFTLHLGIGAVVAGATLALIPFVLWLCLLPLFGDPAGMLGVTFEAGWTSAWGPPAGVVTLVLLIHVVAGAGALLERFAPALLGPSPADRLAALQERARRLAARNRLARELHDSVGHALSVVTVQAGAAGRVLGSDPEMARAALTAIEETTRAALEDLDHVLGVLREETDREGAGDKDGDEDGGRGPVRTLADLPELIRATGAAAEVTGDLGGLPALVSREAYRILQEALTNAIRHGARPVRLVAAVGDDGLSLDVRNPIGERPGPGGGRGLAGMRERVALLGGRIEARAAGGEWLVTVRLPLHGDRT
ncbi:histidine kinase [Planomonospora sp. ID67723]|uniref:sensor histidine kinase n=1 Tax=Planomonospora sp. ID67723 TaxID=2738134 RepID=UPI0027DCEC58|nr:histidine kinase [Planomonospora sp. ID67723]